MRKYIFKLDFKFSIRLNYRFEEKGKVTEAEYNSEDKKRCEIYVGLACGSILLMIVKSIIFVFIVYRFV
jgi:hypothetical protein